MGPQKLCQILVQSDNFFLTQAVSKRKDLMNIPKVKFHMKSIPFHMMRVWKNLFSIFIKQEQKKKRREVLYACLLSSFLLYHSAVILVKIWSFFFEGSELLFFLNIQYQNTVLSKRLSKLAIMRSKNISKFNMLRSKLVNLLLKSHYRATCKLGNHL